MNEKDTEAVLQPAWVNLDPKKPELTSWLVRLIENLENFPNI